MTSTTAITANSNHPGLRIILSATLAPASGFFGYFSVYPAASDWSVEAPLFREESTDWQLAYSAREALERAQQRSSAWLRTQP